MEALFSFYLLVIGLDIQDHVTSSLRVKNGKLCLDGGGDGCLFFFLHILKDKNITTIFDSKSILLMLAYDSCASHYSPEILANRNCALSIFLKCCFNFATKETVIARQIHGYLKTFFLPLLFLICRFSDINKIQLADSVDPLICCAGWQALSSSLWCDPVTAVELSASVALSC